jgi:glycosyltransferase involved in cell wall biosynthesis
MRIGLITGEYPPMQGGVGAYTREIARALKQQGHHIAILTDQRASDSELAVTASINNWNWGTLVQARQWAEANKLDLVNIQYEAAAFGMAPLIHLLPMRLGTIPTVTTFHDLMVPYLFPKAGPLRYQALLAVARGSDGVIVTNQQDDQQLRRERDIPPLRQIPIGSNIEVQLAPDYDRHDWRARLKITDEGLLIGYFGFLNASKGVETLLNGIAQLKDLNIRLLMIGGRTGSSDPSNAAYANQVDALVDRLGIKDRIIWTGFVDGPQVSGHLTACDLVVLPFNDGVSLRRGSFMAAIAHGCAIITTTPAVTIPELHDGIEARLMPIGDPDSLAGAVRELAGNPTLRQQLQANARKLANSFTWDQIASKTAAFYREIIGAAAR